MTCSGDELYFSLSSYRDDLVIGAGSNVGALLVDGLGDGILLEASDKDFDFVRNTSFNLLQGCRMRNTKTVRICPTSFDNYFILDFLFLKIKFLNIILFLIFCFFKH